MSKIISRPEQFFSGLAEPRDEILLTMEREAAEEAIPIVGPVVGSLLGILAGAAGAGRVLELGCATGYSAVFLARGVTGSGGRVVTVERDQERARRAAANFAAAGVSHAVEILVGEAEGILAGLAGPFDLVFLDIDKRAYLDALPHCLRLLRPGGLLVADNTAFPEAEAFVQALRAGPEWRSVHLFSFLPGHSPEHDGISIAMKRG